MTEQHSTQSREKSDDLLEQLRQVSDALWDSVGRKEFGKAEELLAKRESLLHDVGQIGSLSESQRRSLMAMKAADKYIMRQMENELNLLVRRISGVGRRRKAANGYRRETPARSFVSRTG